MLSDKPIGQPFIQLSEVESTNNYAMAEVQAQMAEHGKVWFAHHQTAGKGQRGKSWATEPGLNIMLSVLIKPARLITVDQFKLSATIATACHDFFSAYTLEETSIKWPNDIYWKDRKAGGILIENVIQQAKWKFAVVGIGMNINQTLFSSDLPNPVSLKQISGRDFNTVMLAKELCNCLNTRWQQLNEKGFEDILTDYNHALYKKGEKVSFKTGNGIITAKVHSVNSQGQLIIDGGKKKFSHGEVEWKVELNNINMI